MSKNISARKSNKYVFTLKNINTEKVEQKYGIKLISNISSTEIPEENITKLSELNVDNLDIETISFLDETKKNHQCFISMIDFSSKTDTILLRYNCYWCKHSFDTKPIGCPIRYVSSQSLKSYYSEISKDIYTIRENITRNRRQNITDPRITVSVKEYYETDGIFCSFNCVKSYIKENKHKKMYNNSLQLLMKLYRDMTGMLVSSIDEAPHWRLLREYGGNMSITKFREGFNKVEYEEHGIIQNTPLFHSVGHLYEEKIKF